MIELRGRCDVVHFFESLPLLAADATTIFIEVGGPDARVVEMYAMHAEDGPYLPRRQTLWPRAQLFRLRFDPATLAALRNLAGTRASPEFVDHLSVFRGDTVILHHPDAFLEGAVIYVSTDLPEQRVVRWGSALGLKGGT